MEVFKLQFELFKNKVDDMYDKMCNQTICIEYHIFYIIIHLNETERTEIINKEYDNKLSTEHRYFNSYIHRKYISDTFNENPKKIIYQNSKKDINELWYNMFEIIDIFNRYPPIKKKYIYEFKLYEIKFDKIRRNNLDIDYKLYEYIL